MTNQQGAPEALTDFEHRHAIRQGHEIAASDGYFEARPQIDSNDRRKVFQAGFERGWDRHAALVEAQQPAPSAAATLWQIMAAAKALHATSGSTDEWAELRQWDVDAYRQRAEQIVAAVLRTAHQPSPTPQADSQPAPVRDYPPLPECDATTVGLGAVWNRHSMRAYVDADRAARAPADSVTAQAGGEINRLRAQVESLTRDCGRRASKIAELGADLKFQEEKHREDRARLQTLYEHQRGECWYWQGDGQDHLESLCNTLPVVIRADQLRALVSTPPAQAADSVLEDAARLWDAFVDEWCNEVGVDKIVNIMGGADKLKAVFLDAARKQGANHD